MLQDLPYIEFSHATLDLCDPCHKGQATRWPIRVWPGQTRVVTTLLSLNGYSVFSLIDDILACQNSEDGRIKLLQEGLEHNAADICARLLCFNFVPKRVLKCGRVQCTCFVSRGWATCILTCIVKIRRHAVPIDMLLDNVFLEIFNFSLCDATMFSIKHVKKWQTLVHVCQWWWQIIFASPCRLALHLSCTHRTPVRKSLSFWPATLPLTTDYPGPPLFRSQPSPHRLLWDDGNIIAALEHPSCVNHIVIHAPSPLLSEVATVMQKPFPAL